MIGQVIFTDTAPPDTAVTVYVAVYNGQQLANVLANLVDSYGRPLPNPVTTSAAGILTFYAVPGLYVLEFEDAGSTITQQIGVGGGPGAWQPSPFVGGPD